MIAPRERKRDRCSIYRWWQWTGKFAGLRLRVGLACGETQEEHVWNLPNPASTRMNGHFADLLGGTGRVDLAAATACRKRQRVDPCRRTTDFFFSSSTFLFAFEYSFLWNTPDITALASKNSKDCVTLGLCAVGATHQLQQPPSGSSWQIKYYPAFYSNLFSLRAARVLWRRLGTQERQ